jgi:hypothetical protein
MGWVVNAKPRQLYPGECPGSHCTGRWVGSNVGLEGTKNSPTGLRQPDRLAYKQLLNQLRYFGTQTHTHVVFALVCACGRMCVV